MRKNKKPENTIFYSNYKDMIYRAKPEEAKEIMVAFCQYAFDDKEPEVSDSLKLLWSVMKGNIDRDRVQYIARCEQNSENARQRHNESVIYTVDEHKYEITYPKCNAENIISEDEFSDLFSDFEGEPQRYIHIYDFVFAGNEDKWSKPYQKYIEQVWKKICG